MRPVPEGGSGEPWWPAAPDLRSPADEPYPFAPDDGPEAFPGIPTALVSGRDLTWYGPLHGHVPGQVDGRRDLGVRAWVTSAPGANGCRQADTGRPIGTVQTFRR